MNGEGEKREGEKEDAWKQGFWIQSRKEARDETDGAGGEKVFCSHFFDVKRKMKELAAAYLFYLPTMPYSTYYVPR